MKYSCCFTGHRIIRNTDKAKLDIEVTYTLEFLIENLKVTRFLAGGALGFDTYCAKTVLKLKERYPHIQLVLVLPCKNQTAKWKQADVDIYNDIMQKADEVIYTDTEYNSACMHKRNRYMVDNSSYCMYYMYKNSGGTNYTVNYAKTKNTKLLDILL